MALAEHLKAAASAGLITVDQATRLGAFIAQREAGTLPDVQDDGERFKLVGGFNDIFVAIGILLVYGALLGFLGNGAIASPMVLMAASAAVAWGLAEVFTARMRLALPSILLSLIFCASAGGLIALLLGPGLDADLWDAMGFALSKTALLPGIAVFAAAALHFWRFRVPINVAIMVVAVLGTILALIAQTDMNLIVAHGNLIILIAGLITFAIAMTFDMSDPVPPHLAQRCGFLAAYGGGSRHRAPCRVRSCGRADAIDAGLALHHPHPVRDLLAHRHHHRPARADRLGARLCRRGDRLLSQ